MFRIWNIRRARFAGEPIADERQAWDLAAALERANSRPYTVVPA